MLEKDGIITFSDDGKRMYINTVSDVFMYAAPEDLHNRGWIYMPLDGRVEDENTHAVILNLTVYQLEALRGTLDIVLEKLHKRIEADT